MDKISALFLAVFFLCATDRASSQDDRGKQIEAAKKEAKLIWYTQVEAAGSDMTTTTIFHRAISSGAVRARFSA